jgi:aryl-alcohol dehydrogenase-like predicted oxidoreductase
LRETKASVYIASKIPPKNMRWPAGHNIPARETFPPEWIVSNVEQSLRNLGVERLDLVQFHVWSDTWMKQDDWWEAVEKLKRQGKIRFWGVSINDHEPDSALELVRSGRADSVQVIFNIFDQSPVRHLFPLCREKSVAVIARVPFDEGSLTGTFTENTVFEEGDWRADYFKGRLPEIVARVSQIKPLLSDQAPSFAQAALKFCLSFPAVSTVIPGMRKVSNVEQNVLASDGRLLPPDLLERLKPHAFYQ